MIHDIPDIPWRKPYYAIGFGTDLACWAIERSVFYDQSIPVPPFDIPDAKHLLRVELQSLLRALADKHVTERDFHKRSTESAIHMVVAATERYMKQLGNITKIPACDYAWKAVLGARHVLTAAQTLRTDADHRGVSPTEIASAPEMPHIVTKYIDQAVDEIGDSYVRTDVVIDHVAHWWVRQYRDDVPNDVRDAVSASIMAEEWNCADSLCVEDDE